MEGEYRLMTNIATEIQHLLGEPLWHRSAWKVFANGVASSHHLQVEIPFVDTVSFPLMDGTIIDK